MIHAKDHSETEWSFYAKGIEALWELFCFEKTKSDGGKPGRPDNYREGLLK